MGQLGLCDPRVQVVSDAPVLIFAKYSWIKTSWPSEILLHVCLNSVYLIFT